jgi:polyphenol oxidase
MNFLDNIIIPDWPAPANIQALMTTRQTDVEKLNLPSEPIWLNQVHGAAVVIADEVISQDKALREADAAYTQKSNIVCVVRTADCLPILITDKKGSVVAAIHAGWKGLACGVIEATLRKLSAPAEELLVWLGAAIGPDRFEVGEDVYEKFPEDHHAFQVIPHHKYLCNIYLLAKNRLKKYGVSHIYGGTECTYTNSHQFYSHRRAKDTGRMVSLIWMPYLF